uniref:Transcription regulator TrmB N-terminal domain-containing protein n=1 Tax=Saccharolobus islandicus TaxID=43080 RepID=Q5W2M3_SACIS|nr:hypothetical protein [Sulfolobus islandicus]CAG38273.1 hypothetical protein [Sulfolobus islandicus]
MVLANTNNNTIKEISRKTGIKEEAVYHLLEFLVIARVVKKENDRYYADETTRTIAEFLLNMKSPEFNDVN